MADRPSTELQWSATGQRPTVFSLTACIQVALQTLLPQQLSVLVSRVVAAPPACRALGVQDMRFSARFRRLTLWNKIAFLGAVASILGIILTLAVYLLSALSQRSQLRAEQRRQAESVIWEAWDLLAGGPEGNPFILRRAITTGAEEASAEQARRLLEKAESLDPESGFLHYVWGVYYRRAGNAKSAIESYRRSLSYDPDDWRVLVALADELRLRGNGVEAVTLLQRAIEEVPENPVAYGLSASVFCSQNDERKAAEYFAKADHRSPGLDVRALEADCRLYQRNFAEAIRLSTTLIADAPSWDAGYTIRATARLEAAFDCEERRRANAERGRLSMFDIMNPRHPASHRETAARTTDCQDDSEAMYRQALGDAEASLAFAPTQGNEFLLRAEILFRLGELEGALADYSRAARLDGDCGPCIFGVGEVKAKQGRHDQAVKDFTTALTMLPARRREHYRARVHHKRGVSLMALRRYDEAIADFNTALSLNPALYQAYRDRNTATISRNAAFIAGSD